MNKMQAAVTGSSGRSNSLSSNTSFALVASSYAAAAATAAAAYWIIRKARQETKTRRAKYTCFCGKVEANIVIPAANYRYMDMPCFQCTCNDCVAVVDKILQSGSAKFPVFSSPGVPNLLIYSSELELIKGVEHIKSMKLSTGTPNRRLYSKCCGTPLGIALDTAPLVMIFPPNVVLLDDNELKGASNDHTEEVPLPASSIVPTICLYHAKAQPGKILEPPTMKLIPGNVAPGFIGACIGRLALLCVLGQLGPGTGFPPAAHVDIGLDTIKTE